jgi:glycolate dehydrogenase FAD-binding subunit
MDTGTSSNPTTITGTLEEKLRSIVGAAYFRPASDVEAVAGLRPRFFVEPGTEKELAAVLRASNEMGLAIIPRSGGTKMGWGNPPTRADMILSTARLNRIVEHVWSDLTVTVQAGCTFQKLSDALAQHGQRLGLDPLWPEQATIGGILSTNDSGAMRLKFGALRDLIIGVTLALPDGTLASSGGKVVKNVAGYDLPKLATGAYGTLGVITRAIFRLHPLPRNVRSFSASRGSAEETQRLMHAVQDSQLAHTALQARFAAGTAPIADILFECAEAGLAAQESQFRLLASPASATKTDATVWKARQELWNSSVSSTIAKLSVLPGDIAKTMQAIENTASSRQINWKAVVQAFGVGWLRLDGPPEMLHAALIELRSGIERAGGSLVLAQRPAQMQSLDAWGNTGDALPLMRALKHQLDSASILNPGRFVGGI